MPELLVDYITSLDGYGAADGWPGFWCLEGSEYLAWLEDELGADYTVLVGANTYRLMSGLADEGEPGTEGLAALSKVVFSPRNCTARPPYNSAFVNTKKGGTSDRREGEAWIWSNTGTSSLFPPRVVSCSSEPGVLLSP